MKKTLILFLFSLVIFSCSKKDDSTASPSGIVGNWELDYVFDYRAVASKPPINATTNALPKTNFIVFTSDGKATFKKLSFATYGVNSFETKDYTHTYTVEGDLIKFVLDNAGKKTVNYLRIKSGNAPELVLKQDKELFLKALEENKTILGTSLYKENLDIYNSHTRFESEVTLIKGS
jgi:hypothetical protein